MFNKGEIVHHTRDEFGSILVIDYRRHRVLTFNSIFEQSKIDRRTPWLPVHEYNRAMLLPVAFRRPKHATVLGLGGGVMAHALHHLLPDCQVQAVELRQAVLEVARECFGLPDSSRLQVTIADARDFIERMPDKGTDLILADLYSADRMNPSQAQRQFIRHCSRALTDNGWLVLNYHRTPDPHSPFFRLLQDQFAVVLQYLSKSNNTVIYASKQQFEALHPNDPVLSGLQLDLPIDWKGLMTKVRRTL